MIKIHTISLLSINLYMFVIIRKKSLVAWAIDLEMKPINSGMMMLFV